MVEESPETVEETATEEAPDIESQVTEAMRSRINHFKEQSDSLTFEGVRRQIEEDLGLEKFALDGHKRFVKQLLLEHLDAAAAADDDDNKASKGSEEMGEGNVHSVKDEATDTHEELESKNNKEPPHSEDEKEMEDSPVMGLLTGKGNIKSETNESLPKKKEEALSESIVKKALWKRASYIKKNSETITMAGLRRMLEKDLKLKEKALDPYKKFISKQLDEVIKTKEVERKTASRQKILDSEGSRKRKKPGEDIKVSGRKSTKAAKKDTKDAIESEDSGNASDDSHSQSSAEKPIKKKETSTPTPAYGKRVEHLKSVIKSCGMSVPPAIYKKVKQAPESKRESQLIKELEEILSREGLSSDPSEKEIKEVRRRKERARELEGIDTSNIVSSSRRRSTASYAPLPKPKLPVESDQDDEDDDSDEDDEEDEEDDGDENDNDDDNNDDEDGSQSEEDVDDGPEGDSE